MAVAERPALGLSVGASNLAAVTTGRAVTRKPVLTLYRHRPPEVGVPSENPNLDEPGLVIADFVDRVGDPVGIVAADGSTHRAAELLADGLRALAYSATGGRSLPEAVAASYPAHWPATAVDALRTALGRAPDWSRRPQSVSLVSDAAAALTALQANPGVPIRGIIAVCDFGGSGSSITLADAANGYQPVAATVRHADFSGDLIDQALLTRVMAELSTAGSLDMSATSAMGSLNRLRSECRSAKERLSSNTATVLTADLPGFRGDIRLTRSELDDAIRQSLDSFLTLLQETLQRNGIHGADLVAVASAGGGASIPAVTTKLSEHLRVPVITAPRPHLTAAIGAAFQAAHGRGDNSETALVQGASASMRAGSAGAVMAARDTPVSGRPDLLAWSQVDDESGVGSVGADESRLVDDRRGMSARPPLEFVADEPAAQSSPAGIPWYRRPLPVILGTTLLVALAAVVGIMIVLRHHFVGAPTTPTPSVSTTPGPAPGSSAPATQSTASAPQAPAPVPTLTQTQTASPLPSASQPASSAPPPTSQPASSAPPPATTQTSQPSTQPPSPTANPSVSGQVPAIPQIPPIPQIPQIPAIPPIP